MGEAKATTKEIAADQMPATVVTVVTAEVQAMAAMLNLLGVLLLPHMVHLQHMVHSAPPAYYGAPPAYGYAPPPAYGAAWGAPPAGPGAYAAPSIRSCSSCCIWQPWCSTVLRCLAVEHRESDGAVFYPSE